MTIKQQELWHKIEAFQFDKTDVKLTFEKRLARENDFTDGFAKDIVFEYKKFIFLCCISKHQITPSHFVDLAWHLHLTYTKSYWIDFCQNTIGLDIHHNPTEGGKSENIKFKNYYNQTLNFYKAVFAENPPSYIWQNDKERFKIRTVNIDITKSWIIPKPLFLNSRPNLLLIGILVFSSMLLFACNPVGNQTFPILFLIFIVGLILFVFFKSVVNNNQNKTSETSSSGCSTSSGGGSGSNDDSDDNSSDSDSSDGGDSDGGGGCSGCGGGGGD